MSSRLDSNSKQSGGTGHQQTPVTPNGSSPAPSSTTKPTTTTNEMNPNSNPNSKQLATPTAPKSSQALQANKSTHSNQQDKQIASTTTTTAKSKLVFGLNPRANRLRHDEYAEKRSLSSQQQSPAPTSDEQSPISSKSASATTKSETSTESMNQNGHQDKTAKIRSSKYGNYYKPQDLLQATNNDKQPAPATPNEDEQTKVATDRKPRRRKSVEKVSERLKSPDRKASPVRSRDKSPSNRNSNSNNNNNNNSSDASSSPIDQPTTRRMQFNIPPPPQQLASLASKGSVVSYAKSRIYDKPAKGPLNVTSNGLYGYGSGGGQSLFDTGVIPKSILSGFKPPKQVNVRKARERWEGGEPFAKCKSRQRLAAQANKKLLHGIWSMTSVVATQQSQLQQAYAQSAASIRSNIHKSDPSVKILTRGSVLERVQQFEKAPEPSLDGSLSSSSSSSSSSSCNVEPGSPIESDSGSSDDSLSPTMTDAGDLPSLNGANQTSKQALYKNRVSSIQQTSNSSPLNEPLGLTLNLKNIASNGPSLKSPLSPPENGQSTGMRRLSSFRRSSTLSIIPKFYHPNGKPPNTYEIELQKKNVVACFDKFPDRSASLVSPTHRKHFHQIALACGFSEYFKEPLYLYVRHQMSESNLLHNPTITSRKQSGIGLAMLGLSTPTTAPSTGANRKQTQDEPTTTTKVNPLARAASVDTSTMEKLANQNYVTCEQFLVCWRNMLANCSDDASRFVHLLTLGKRNYLIPDDFIPLIQSVIDDHPGLSFLRAAPDFHLRYIQTVIARIYYCINRSWSGKLSANEIRKSNLLAVLKVLSQEEDINQITDYFSYEHFYVIYCKFWNLDQDHDLLISKEDLARHNDAAISSRIIDRIFSGVVSKQIKATNKMSYFDFVWFLIAEEDKKHPRSVEYWFRLMDLDGDGYISMYEMEYFYYEQTKRLELMNIEALPFLDSACQILDLVNPKEKSKISLSDLKRTKMATIFFDTFINLEKYLEHESREFVSTRDIVQDGVVISDWDRYASEEYEALVAEETKV